MFIHAGWPNTIGKHSRCRERDIVSPKKYRKMKSRTRNSFGSQKDHKDDEIPRRIVVLFGSGRGEKSSDANINPIRSILNILFLLCFHDIDGFKLPMQLKDLWTGHCSNISRRDIKWDARIRCAAISFSCRSLTPETKSYLLASPPCPPLSLNASRSRNKKWNS